MIYDLMWYMIEYMIWYMIYDIWYMIYDIWYMILPPFRLNMRMSWRTHVQKSYGRTENRTAVLKTKNKPRKQSTFFFSTFTNKIGACARNRTRVRFFLRPYGFRTSCTVYVHFVRCSSTCVRQPIRMFKRNGGSTLLYDCMIWADNSVVSGNNMYVLSYSY